MWGGGADLEVLGVLVFEERSALRPSHPHQLRRRDLEDLQEGLVAPRRERVERRK